MANRLARALSPYLRQHADNPVDWYEWGPEAFAAARDRDVPILLSVGYAACHWCHVMAHESFEDARVAAVLADGFVAVKVDREERPDVDAVYMSAVTAMTGHGGWPMTAFLTPDGTPFFAGTYYPRHQFLQVLAAVGEAWSSQREAVTASAQNIAQQLTEGLRPLPPSQVSPGALSTAVGLLAQQFDAAHGGFGGAPKFPPSMVLEFLLRHWGRTGDPRALAMADSTCEAMARSGMYDQIAGGFARYSVDAAWVVPHFEKMLYDNAQLLRVYAHWWRATRKPLARKVVEQTAQFLLRDLLTEEGMFASSLDADTEGVEGLTYVWTPGQLVEALGEQDGADAAKVFAVTPEGTFEHGSSTLQLLDEPPAQDEGWLERVRATLSEVRAQRPQPARDDKAVTSWNAMAVAALAEAGSILQRPDWVEAATRCADALLDLHLVDGRLRRVSLGGSVSSAGALADDHGNLAEALVQLHMATGERRFLDAAHPLLDTALTRFGAGDGGFHDTADDAEQLYLRPRSIGDNAEPSGESALAMGLLALGSVTGDSAALDSARSAVESGMSLGRSNPRFAGWTLAAAEALADGPVQVAVVGTGEVATEMQRAVALSPRPGLVRAFGEPDQPGVPLLADRPVREGSTATAYVCRGFVCDAPVVGAADLAQALSAPGEGAKTP